MNKGEKGGECARTACHNPDARWFNRSTRKHYCTECAYQIIDANVADAERLFGGPICVLDDSTVDRELLLRVADYPELLEVGREAVQRELIARRDSRLSLVRNNGVVIYERTGERSNLIRMGVEDALSIGLKAMVAHLRGTGEHDQ